MGLVTKKSLLALLQANNEMIKGWVEDNFAEGVGIEVVDSVPPTVDPNKLYLVHNDDKITEIVYGDSTRQVSLIVPALPENIATTDDIELAIGKIPTATKTRKGLMSTSDKTKLDGFKNYVHPSHTPVSLGLYQIEVDALGHVVNAIPVGDQEQKTHTRHIPFETMLEDDGICRGYVQDCETRNITIKGVTVSRATSNVIHEVLLEQEGNTYDLLGGDSVKLTLEEYSITVVTDVEGVVSIDITYEYNE